MNQKVFLQKLSEMLSGRCTPETITSLRTDDVFVFGSKPNGEHNSGAAKTAVEKFGAVEGKAEGMSDQSYAIPVHRHKTEIMAEAVSRFVEYARVHVEQIFYVLIKALKKDILIPEDEQLPIVYVDEIINADCLRGRMLGLMAEISKGTEKPITFDDEILKKDNILLSAFLRIPEFFNDLYYLSLKPLL